MKNYEAVKAINIVMTAALVPLGTLTGYALGSGDYSKAEYALIIQTVFVFIQATIWWRTAELIGFRKSP